VVVDASVILLRLVTPAIEACLVKPKRLAVGKVRLDLDVAVDDGTLTPVTALATALSRSRALMSVLAEVSLE
jgi:hypothetical protein